jgi:MoaA/NifB/PqqE/SkfB family radical SAM enzyme
MCPRPKIKDLEVGDMELDLLMKILRDVSCWIKGRASFTPVGLGEPLMYPYLPDALEHIKEKLPDSSIIINTNGVLLNRSNAERLVNSMDRSNDTILISLNAETPQDYRWLMGADRYDQVVANIKRLMEIRNKMGLEGPKIVIQLLETENARAGMLEFEKYWAPFLSLKDSIYVKQILNWGGKVDVSDFCANKKGKRYPCLSLWLGISIDKEGNVYPCCEGFSSRKKSDLILGNIRDNSLEDSYKPMLTSSMNKFIY